MRGLSVKYYSVDCALSLVIPVKLKRIQCKLMNTCMCAQQRPRVNQSLTGAFVTHMKKPCFVGKLYSAQQRLVNEGRQTRIIARLKYQAMFPLDTYMHKVIRFHHSINIDQNTVSKGHKITIICA